MNRRRALASSARPLSGHFVEGRIQREDRLPVPPDALREILLNAVMHRDYSDPGGDLAVAVFDDRIEIRSSGTLPSGITAAMLSGPHESILRNPLIAGAFHRTGAVEVWGRGTNRVIEECKRWGVAPPSFEVVAGSLWVTFPAVIGPGGEPRHQVGTKSALGGHQVQVLEASTDPQASADPPQLCGRFDRTKFRDQVVRPLLEAGLPDMMIPSKPRNSRQRDRTTKAGKEVLSE
jgi:ATP-dependent DNA helicase RecG